jgi:fatty acid desaturase
MNKAKVVFHSVRQEERPRERHYRKDWPIVIVLIILYGALSVLLGLWQAPVPTLISAL